MIQTTQWVRAMAFLGLGFFLGHSPDIYAQAYDSGRARIDYILQCQGCHRADGSGATQSTPSLLTDGELFLQSQLGREFFISVPGVVHAPLSDEALTSVINYVIQNLIIKEGDFESLFYTVPELTVYRKTKMTKNIAQRRREVIAKLRENK